MAIQAVNAKAGAANAPPLLAGESKVFRCVSPSAEPYYLGR